MERIKQLQENIIQLSTTENNKYKLELLTCISDAICFTDKSFVRKNLSILQSAYDYAIGVDAASANTVNTQKQRLVNAGFHLWNVREEHFD